MLSENKHTNNTTKKKKKERQKNPNTNERKNSKNLRISSLNNGLINQLQINDAASEAHFSATHCTHALFFSLLACDWSCIYYRAALRDMNVHYLPAKGERKWPFHAICFKSNDSFWTHFPSSRRVLHRESITFSGLGILLEPLVTVHRIFYKEQDVPVSLP